VDPVVGRVIVVQEVHQPEDHRVIR
jgi:hypothetical protein